jgi:hypothetical protein
MKLITLFLLPALNCFSQQTDLGKTSDWKLYEIRNDKAFSYSFDTLKTFKNISLDNDTIKMFLQNVSKIKKGISPVWMGLYVASCKLNDDMYYKIDVSVYGGFFYIEKNKTYYEIPEDLRQDWLKYFHDKLQQLSNTTP